MDAAGRVDIVFSDIDGTIAADDHHPIPESAPTLRRVHASGVPVCLVTARSPTCVEPFRRALGFVGPIACYSGAYVLDADGTELLSRTMPVDVALGLLGWLRSELPGVLPMAYGFHDWVVEDRDDPRVREEERNVQTASRECRDLRGAFGERGLHKLLLSGSSEQVGAAERAVGERFPELTVVRSNDVLCEVMAGGVGKAEAVRVLCGRYGVDPANAAAFGDGPNDLDMLLAVGHGYAMANAEEGVRRAVGRVTRWTNMELGVPRTLEELLPAAR